MEKAIEKAYLGGGCFWGMEELFRSFNGVLDTEVGYCGDSEDKASYEIIKSSQTNHAETLEVTFDSSKVSFFELLVFFFKIHDPTSENRQGNDVGSQYRSVIFFNSTSQESTAKKVIQHIEKAQLWKNPIVTKLEPFINFYSAEKEHQDYLQKNPGGYTCHFIREV